MKEYKALKILITVLTLLGIAAYLLLPLFSLPIFGVETGAEMIGQVWKIGGFGNIASFLLPIIGAVGIVATIFLRNKATHILSSAFSLLPVMFYTYMIIMANNYTQPLSEATSEVGFTMLFGSGLWSGAVISTIVMIATFVTVLLELKNINPLEKSFKK